MSIEQIVEDDSLESRWIKEAILEGQRAFKQKRDLNNNPYKDKTSIAMFKNYGWSLGWRLAMKEYKLLKKQLEDFFNA